MNSRFPKTPEGARQALHVYETQNADLPEGIRRLMGLSALGKYYGRKHLEAAVGEKLPRLPFRDWSWRWWNALNLSGLGHHWESFLRYVQRGGLRAAATYLRAHSTPDQYLLFLKRAGTNPHNHHKPVRDVIWTKGGCWRIESPMTRLLVQKKHLPARPVATAWQQRIVPVVRVVETELMNLVNPDAMLSYEAKALALDYVRRRLPQLLGSKRPRFSLETACWFFQQPIPGPLGTLVPYGRTGYVTLRWHKQAQTYWSW